MPYLGELNPNASITATLTLRHTASGKAQVYISGAGGGQSWGGGEALCSPAGVATAGVVHTRLQGRVEVFVDCAKNSDQGTLEIRENGVVMFTAAVKGDDRWSCGVV